MEALTRLVSESLARYGFDRPVDYRRLRWSRWFRCESVHSLLFVPSQPGVFALAEEIVRLTPAPGAEGRRMLAVTHFFEDDDMAFVLDRMLSRQNPLRDRLLSGRYFIRYVVIEDTTQRRSIGNALNQWIANSAEKASGIGAHFASSLEITETRVGAEAEPCPERARASRGGVERVRPASEASMKEDGAESSVPRPSPFPSGF